MNYGTKWSDASTEFIEVEGDRIVVHFESAWSPMWKLAEKISKDLKQKGFRFVGPTVVYSYMQAIGMVNDHLESCFRHSEVILKR